MLTTDRMLIRSWRDDDRAPFAALNADPVVRRWFPGILTREESDATVDRFIDHEAERGYTPWAVEDRATGAFVGMVGLNVPSFEPPFAHAAEPCVEVGWRLGAEWWGQGRATEAARACLGYAFDELGLPEVVAFTVPANAASRAVMDRLGMRHDPAGDFDHPNVPEDSPLRRHVLYRTGGIMAR